MRPRVLWERALFGSRWLIDQQTPDGGWRDLPEPKIDSYYKVSWALAATGCWANAHRSLTYAHRHFLAQDGDFAPRGHPWHREVHYLYANAYFIIGSMTIGRYELARPALSFLLSQQDTHHGGFYSIRTAEGSRNRCDTMSVSAAGIACLAAGRVEEAERAGDFLRTLVDRQPETEKRFYTTVEPDGRIATDPTDDAEAWWKIIDTKKENQCWYAVGLPFAFLIRLSDAVGKPHFRDTAQWFFDFQQRCVDPWDGGSSGKAGWACSMLYRATGEQRYRDIALHIAGKYAAAQKPDGRWTPGTDDTEQAAPVLTDFDFDVTAELTLWIALIAGNIAARDADDSLRP